MDNNKDINYNIDEIIEGYKEELSDVCNTLDFLNDRKEYLNNQIVKQKYRRTKEIKFSAHSIIRYFERVLGYDIDEIKKEMMKNGLQQRYEVMGDGIFDQGNFRATIKNGTYLTVINPKEKK